ncbi:MAG: gluconate 2-dehydrogenase subunit 3 family protein [Dokdonia sp.]|nr:hypothetical protein [Cytophagaceae bacterium]
MKRRQVLKNLGLGATALVATPSILSLLQSCSNEPEFIPAFLSKEEGHALRSMVDLIIPSDETIPGAKDLGVHEFIDSYWNEVVTEEDQAQIRLGFAGLAGWFQKNMNKPLEEGSLEDYDKVLAKFLKASEVEEAAFREKLGEFYQAYQRDKSVIPDTDASAYSIVNNIRGMTIWGWRASEEIGENVLAYEPIPGQQIGCLPLSEATGGKAYSL